MERVLNTTELPENILIHATFGDLLIRAPRVCKKWRDTIKQSPKLQQALFLETLPGPPVEFYYIDKNTAFWAEDNTGPATETFENTFLDAVRAEIHLDRFGGLRYSQLLRSDATWRRMLICQPPTHRTKVYPNAICAWKGIDEGEIVNTNGVTIADICILPLAGRGARIPLPGGFFSWTRQMEKPFDTVDMKRTHYPRPEPSLKQEEEEIERGDSEWAVGMRDLGLNALM